MEPSSKSSGVIKTFTLREANDLIPYVSRMLEKAFSLNGRIKSLTNDIENLVFIWGKDVLENGHIDNAYYFSKVSEREETLQELIRKISEIQATGCVVKDIESGLVDFYYDNRGELVLLCWKYGEDKINHWHTLDGGFKSRKEIKHLK